MANKRIKDITTASSAFASDDFLVTDSATSGTRKITKDNLIAQVSAGVSGDYLEESNNLSDVASKDTAKLNLEVPDIGSGANEVSLNGMLNSGAWLDFDAFYSEGTWVPTVSFGGGSTGVTYNTQLGTYTRVGNTVHIQASITLNSVGIDTGGATIDGLPFPSYSANYATLSIWSLGMSGLTSNILGRVTNSGTKIDLYDSSATGSSYISNVNFTASSILRFSATYQIQ